jgi:hypothetical protein
MVTTTDFNGRSIWGPSSGSPVQTTNIDYDRRDIDISEEIAYYYPKATAFLSILMRVGKKPTRSTEYIWWDKDKPDWWTKLAASYIAGDTNIDIEDASFLNKKDLIRNVETGEIFFITAIDYGGGTASSDRLTVETQYGYDSTASTGTQETDSNGSDDEILKLGNAMEENSLAPDSWATQPVKRFNYVQTFRDPFDSSADNQAEGKVAGPDTRARLRREKLIEHRINIERQVLFGERNEIIDNTENKVRRTTGGVLQFIKEGNDSGVYDLGSENNGILTETEWSNYCSEALKYGSDTKLFLTSRYVAQVLDGHASGRIETTTGEEIYGMNLSRYITTHVDVIIATTELFENYYAKMGLMLDIENLKLRPFAGEDSTLKTNIQENDRDGWKDEYMSKIGLQLDLPKTHTVLEGVEK